MEGELSDVRDGLLQNVPEDRTNQEAQRPLTLIKHVLIVDDDRAFVEAVALFLQDQGYSVMTAFNGREGLALLRAGHTDVAVLDVHIPDRSGLELAEEAGTRPIPVPIILISGDDSPEIQEQCELLGARFFLPKPLAPEALLTALAQTCGEP